MDNSVYTLAAIACTLLVPISTALINNAHETKMLSARSKIENEQRAISEYLKWASVLSSNPQSIEMDAYKKSYGEVFLYAPKSVIKDIEELNRLINERRPSEEAKSMFNKIAEDMTSYYTGKPKAKK